MGSLTLSLTVLLAAFYGSWALKCNHCIQIDKNQPNCTQVEERLCAPMFTHCLWVTLHPPAYGEVRKCATEKECNNDGPAIVVKHCCTEDLCN